MVTSSFDGDRGLYRIQVPKNDQIAVAVETSKGNVCSGEIVDLSSNGAAIRFSTDTALQLSPGDKVMLSLSSPLFQARCDAAATVVSDVATDTGRRCGFNFDNPDDIARSFPQQLFRLFNRRSEARITPEKTEREATVTIRLPEQIGSGIEYSATLKDLSPGGASIGVDETVDAMLNTVDQIELLLQLPGISDRLRLAATFRHRRREADVFYHGLKFDPTATEDYLTQAEEILEYTAKSSD